MHHDADPRLPLEATLYQVKKTIVGQDGLLQRRRMTIDEQPRALERSDQVLGQHDKAKP